MKFRIAVAALTVGLLMIGVPAAQAAPRKPFHCHYTYTGRYWRTFFLPSYRLDCDRVWN